MHVWRGQALFNPRQVAEILDRTEGEILQLIIDGKIPAKQMGRTPVVGAEIVQAMFEGKRKVPTPKRAKPRRREQITRCMDLRPKPAVYRLYGDHDRLLYVGVTDNVFRRVAAHSGNPEWGSLVTRVEWDEFPDREAAEIEELRQIVTLKPRHNVVGAA